MSARTRFAGAILACVACAATGAPSTQIEGREWRQVELRGHDPNSIAALRERPSVRFESGRAQAATGGG
jgi:hypothetical protein